jgi:hypothetical protein
MIRGLLPGDIVAVKGKGVVGWLSRNAFLPHTDRFHFLLIAEYIECEDDYVILESIARKGIAIGRLSWYLGKDVEVYRVPADSQYPGRLAVTMLTRYGRCGYDYLLPAKLMLGAMRLLVSGKLPPWRPEQLPYGRDSRYLCTEAANEAWRLAGYVIIPEGVCPLPAGFISALCQGRLIRIYKGMLQDEVTEVISGNREESK